jgi:acetyltransferase
MSVHMRSLSEIFSPKSIAIVGASRKEGTVGHKLFQNMLSGGFTGVVYPVNPHWPSVGGVRCYPGIRDLPETPDLAVVIVPAGDVPHTIQELAERGTRGAIIISSGFKEVGGEGAWREEEVVRVANRRGMSIVGPNCFGVFNTDPEVRMNATFSDVLPPAGNIAFASQSGALGVGILLHAKAQGIGFTKFVSFGNRADVNEADLLETLGRDEKTKVILLYLESLAEGRRFLKVATEVTRKKPILIIKSGRTSLGEEAVKSHTGTLAHAHSDKLFDAVFDEAGVIRAGSLAELFCMAKVFASCPLPRGPNLAILTNSGGPGILAADTASRAGLYLPSLPQHLREDFSHALPRNSSLRNPVDMTGDASPTAYGEGLKGLLSEETINGVMVIATPTRDTTGRAVAEALIEARHGNEKPIVACLFGLADLSQEVALLEAHGIPCFTFPEEAASAFASLSRYAGMKNRPQEEAVRFKVDTKTTQRIFADARRGHMPTLPDHMARELLKAYGFTFPASQLVHTEEEAVAAAAELGYPVVLKVSSQDILHKSDVGGVMLHLDSDQTLAEALRTMQRKVKSVAPAAKIDGFVVEKEMIGGPEVILGMKRDPDFGPVILFGIGGIFVEAFNDVDFRPAPLTPKSADRLIASIRASAILQGLRGQEPSDIAALKDAMLRLSQLSMEQDLVKELDINPLLMLARGKGTVAVDSRIILA